MTTRIVPAAWMPEAKIVRVIFHWTAGTHKATEFDRGHYHVLVEADGKAVRGIPVISGNSAVNPKGKIAHHTLNTNTGSAGVSACCMGGAEESPFKAGKYPLTRAQWQALALVIADICERYKIPVTARTVLSHAEVQGTLNIKQRGKWDFTRLAFDPSVKGPKACGDHMRSLVDAALKGVTKPLAMMEDTDDGGEPDDPIPTFGGDAEPVPEPVQTANPPTWLQTAQQAQGERVVQNAQMQAAHAQGDPAIFSVQSRLNAMNYSPGGLDGIWGGKTVGAIAGFLTDRGGHVKAPLTLEEFRKVYVDLVKELTHAEQQRFVRPVTPERAAAQPEVVARVAPETVPQKRNFLAGLWATITGFFALIFEQIKGFFSSAWDFYADNKDALPQDKGIVQTVWEHFTGIPPTFWIVAVLGVFGFITYNAYRANQISTDQVRTGER